LTPDRQNPSDLQEVESGNEKPYILRRERTESPESWSIHRLGDLLELEYGRSLPENDRNEGPFPVFGSNGRSGWHSDYHIEAPGIIVGRKGVNLGIEWSVDDFNVIDTAYFINQGSLKNSDISLRFLYYNLLNFDLDRLKSGSAVPGLNRNDFYEEYVAVPPIDEQEKIANVLDSFDEKRKINTRINIILEEIAQAIFNYWFVEFGPYSEFEYVESKKIPADFNLGELSDLVSLKKWKIHQERRPK
jgi:type I restriction enzyme S subunit